MGSRVRDDPSVEERAQQLGGGLGIIGVADRPHDDDPRGAGARRLGDVIGVDSADGEPGDRRFPSGELDQPEAGCGRPGLVGVSQTGPTLSWSGRSSPGAAQAASICSGEWVESPISASGPATPAGLGHRHVILAHMGPVRSAGRDEVGAVVEDEERSVLGDRAPKWAGEATISSSERRLLLP